MLGVFVNAIAVLILGILVFLSGFLAPILSPEIAVNLSGTGGIMIIAICLSMLKLVDYKIANSLPAIFIPIIYGIIFKIFKKRTEFSWLSPFSMENFLFFVCKNYF
ncbi:MAG: DUF554 family protein [Peptoniphilus harei]|nr:DUF554 family protein [Peptoniphilus harei]